MTSHKKHSPLTVALAFAVICIVLAAVVLVRETWRYRELRQFTRSIPEFQASNLGSVTLFTETFSDSSLVGWREDIRSGKTLYDVTIEADGNSALRARSENSASLLIKRVQYDPRRFPYVKWRWRVEKMPPTADMTTPGGGDAPARLYVAFYHGFGAWNTRLINYVWASSMKKGSTFHSVFSSNSRILVLESGPEKVGQWVSEERNVLEDYRSLFGEEPNQVEAVAVMSDMDNTHSSAVSLFDDIAVSNQP